MACLSRIGDMQRSKANRERLSTKHPLDLEDDLGDARIRRQGEEVVLDLPESFPMSRKLRDQNGIRFTCGDL
jgi:hypothetical protein